MKYLTDTPGFQLKTSETLDLDESLPVFKQQTVPTWQERQQTWHLSPYVKMSTFCLIKKLKLPIRSVSQDQKAGSKEKEVDSKRPFAEAWAWLTNRRDILKCCSI